MIEKHRGGNCGIGFVKTRRPRRYLVEWLSRSSDVSYLTRAPDEHGNQSLMIVADWASAHRCHEMMMRTTLFPCRVAQVFKGLPEKKGMIRTC